MLRRLYDIFTTIAKPWLSGGRELRERVNNRQKTYLSPGDQLAVNKTHSLRFVAVFCINAIRTQLSFHAPFWRRALQFKVHLIVKAVNPLGIQMPSFTAKQHMDTPVAVVHTRICDLFNAFLELGLFIAMGTEIVGRTMRLQHTTGTPDADVTNRA